MALTQVDQGLLSSTAQYTGFKNRIINGAMSVNQYAPASPLANIVGQNFAVDRFQSYGNVASKYTAFQNYNNVTPPAGYANYLGIQSSSAYSLAASDILIIRQLIEGYNVYDFGFGTANAATITVSFWVRSSLTGTFGCAIFNHGTLSSYPFAYTISAANTWEQKTISIAGPTSGGAMVSNNQSSLQIFFQLGVGTNSTGTANSWQSGALFGLTGATNVLGTNGATWYVTGVQIEKGSTATSFDYRPYTTELQLCQRYFQYSRSYFEYAMGSTGNLAGPVVTLPTTMRASPTFTQISTAGANTTIGGPSIIAVNGSGPFAYLVGYNSSSTGYGYRDVIYSLSAEL